jgi:hypothetical protein
MHHSIIRLPEDVHVHYDRAISGFTEDENGVAISFAERTNVVCC